MYSLLLGIILIVALVFLAFLVTITVLSAKGQPLADAGRETLMSGWRGLKSRFGIREMEPFEDMRKDRETSVNHPHASKSGARSRRSARSGYTTAGDINAPAADAYDSFAAEAMAEDLDAMAGRHRFSEDQLPAPPLTDDMLRYVGDYEVKPNDPLLSSALVRSDIGRSNTGFNIWSS